MTTPKFLPERPSLESLRKQAKKLARDVAAGNADAISRARAQLPETELPLSQRDAQLVLAREYGYAGWQDLTAEVLKRAGKGLQWAAARAQRLIHDNDVAGLKQLLTEHPALLSWRGEGGGLLASATDSYSDSFDPARERTFTRRECAEVLLDAGAEVDLSVCEGLVASRARGLLQLFHSRGLLPRTLRFLVALGDFGGVRACFDERGALGADTDNERAVLNDGFMCACRFENEAIASFLLDRCIALDAALGEQIDGGPGRAALIAYLIEENPLAFIDAAPESPWQAFLMHQVVRSIHDNDLATFARVLQRESWLLGESWVGFQVGLIGRATLRDRGPFIVQLLDLAPALLRRDPPPPGKAIEFAFTYGMTHLVPVLTRVWPVPDDLPHAAGIGDLARVKRMFDDEPRHGAPESQSILDHALAYAVLNRHFDVADFLLEHGADINTRWSSHEPASLLHELVFRDDYEGMQFLIDRGIDMTIRDHRWRATAEGWARIGANNETMGEWLADAQRRRSKNDQ
jgi:hypothetical protein